MTLQPAGSSRNSTSILHSASNVTISGGSFIGLQQTYETKEISGQANSLKPVHDRVASNAILNAGGRADTVRCHPGTREEVIGIIEKWIDGDGDLSRSIFWLSGPAGAGKSAIIQTIAERCIQRKAPMANYFFFRADSTRNHANSVVATILYQLLQLLPALKAQIIALLDTKPLIFEQSVRDQFEHLVEIPVRTVVDDTADVKRLVLLIDGLDECSQDAKHIQQDLLQALHHLGSQQGSPFVVLVASRAEPHLVTTFNEIGSSNDSIFLDESYRPSDDIRLFVATEFDKIKKNHHLRETLDGSWPSKAVIDGIVEKSSGQFIYAATVMRFIFSSPASPAHSLEKVRGIRPIVKNSPFAELDAIYTHILSQAEDWESAKDVIASHLILPKVTVTDLLDRYVSGQRYKCTICPLLAPLGLMPSDVVSHLSELVAVVQYDGQTESLKFYHASLQDFLLDKSRSKDLFIDLDCFVVKLAAAHVLAISSIYDVKVFCCVFPLVEISTPLLKDALLSWEPWNAETLLNDETSLRMGVAGRQCINCLQKLYSEDDNSFYQTMLRKWLTWFYDLNMLLGGLLNDREALKIWTDLEENRTRPSSIVAACKRAFNKIRLSMLCL